jgi:hypothetical protein
MGGSFAPRFLVEAGFLALLAVGAGFADLEPIWIVIVMAAGWALVTLIELLAWRAERGVALEPRLVSRDGEEEEAAEPDSWDIEEILAPLPEEDPGHTNVLPAREEPEGEARTG